MTAKCRDCTKQQYFANTEILWNSPSPIHIWLPIRPQFCTCNDRWSIMSCAKSMTKSDNHLTWNDVAVSRFIMQRWDPWAVRVTGYNAISNPSVYMVCKAVAQFAWVIYFSKNGMSFVSTQKYHNRNSCGDVQYWKLFYGTFDIILNFRIIMQNITSEINLWIFYW